MSDDSTALSFQDAVRSEVNKSTMSIKLDVYCYALSFCPNDSDAIAFVIQEILAGPEDQETKLEMVESVVDFLELCHEDEESSPHLRLIESTSH